MKKLKDGDSKARALMVVRDRFGDAEIWSKAADALLERLVSSEEGSIGLSDLAVTEESNGLSVSHILFPILNLLSTDDVGILRREFLRTDTPNSQQVVNFDEVRQMASESDWTERLSMRWTLQEASASHPIKNR